MELVVVVVVVVGRAWKSLKSSKRCPKSIILRCCSLLLAVLEVLATTTEGANVEDAGDAI